MSFTKIERELAASNPVKKQSDQPKETQKTTLKPAVKGQISTEVSTLVPTKTQQKQLAPNSPRKSKLPVKSPVRETIKAFQKNSAQLNKKSNKLGKRKDEIPKSEQSSRPSTTVNINYSIDSDESMMMDNLMNNPEELKKILREGKKEKEQLNQLQENYLHLLEQYAEKENFIDMFRLHGYNAAASTAPATPSANMFGVYFSF